MATTTQTAKLRAEFDDKASQGIGKLQSAMAVAAGSSLALGNGLKAAGASAKVMGFIMTTVGTGMIASLGGAANAAAQFRKELALAKTQVDDSRISLDFLAETAHDIGAEIPGEFERMPRLMFDLFSTLHPEIDKVEGATRSFMKAATAGFADIQDVSRTTMQVLNAFFSDFDANAGTMGVEISDINKVLDMQFRMVQRGTGTYDELTAAVNRIIPAAKGAGQEVETMMGSVAFLTRMGVPAQMAGTSVARAMEVIGRSSEDLESMGISARNANGEFRQINEIITDMASEWADLSKPELFRALDEAFSGRGWRIQARRFFQLAIPNFEILNALINDVAMSSGDMQKAFETVSDQPAMQMKLLTQQTKILVQEIGTEFLPHLRAVVDLGQTIVQWLRDYNKESGTSIGRIIAMGGAFLTMAGILTTATGALMVFKGLSITTGVAFFGMFGKIALVVGIIGAAIAAFFALAQKFEGVKEAGFNVMAGFEQVAFSGNRLHQAMMLLAVTSAPALIKNWRNIGPALRKPITSARGYVRSLGDAWRSGTAASKSGAKAQVDAARQTVNAHKNAAEAARTRFDAGRNAMARSRDSIINYRRTISRAEESITASTKRINQAWGHHGATVRDINKRIGRDTVEAQRQIQNHRQATIDIVNKEQVAIQRNRNLITNANRQIVNSQRALRESAATTLAQRQRLLGANQQVVASQAAVVSSTKRLGSAMHALRGAQAAVNRGISLIGSGLMSLVNPTTLVIGGIMALVFWMQKSGKEAREFEQDVNKLSEALKEVNFDTEELSSKTIGDVLHLDDAELNNLEEYGIEFRDLVQAARQGGDSLEAVRDRLNDIAGGGPAPTGFGIEGILPGVETPAESAVAALEALDKFDAKTEQSMRSVRREIEGNIGKSIESTDAFKQEMFAGRTGAEALGNAMGILLNEGDNLDQLLRSGINPETKNLAKGLADGEHNVNQLAASATDARSKVDALSESFSETASEIVDSSAAMEESLENIASAADLAGGGIDEMLSRINEARSDAEGDLESLEVGDLSLSQLAQGVDEATKKHEQFFDDIQRITNRGAGDVAKMLVEMGDEGIEAAAKLADAGDEQFVRFVTSSRRNMDAAAKPVEDFADRAAFSIDRWIEKMEEQIQAAKNFESNIAEIMARTGGDKDILQLISESERPEMVAAGLADATDEQLQAAADISDRQGKRSGAAFTNGFERALEEFPDLTRLLTSGQVADIVANVDDLSFDTLETALREKLNEEAIAVEVKLRSAIDTDQVTMVERKLREHTAGMGTDVGSEVAVNIGKGVIENISPALPNAMSAFDSRLNSEGNQMGVTADNVGRSVVERLAGGIDAGRSDVANSLAQLRAMTTAQLNSVLADINSARSRLAVQRAATDQPVTGLAGGGPVVGPPGHDKVPAALTAGEWVINKSAVQQVGPEFMRALNEGRLTERNSGGRVGSPAPVGNKGGRDPLLTEVKGLRSDLKSQRVVSVAVHNPQPEPASTSVTRELRKRTGTR